jgi:type IV pilus assembly protein PilB
MERLVALGGVMEATNSKRMLSGFAHHLIENGRIDKQIAFEALEQSTHSNISYIDYLAKHKLMDESLVALSTAEYFGLPLCDINAFDETLIPAEYLNTPVVRKRLALPIFKKGGVLFLAVTDPTIEHLSEIHFLTGLDTRLLIVESSKLGQAIDVVLNKLILSEISDSEIENVNSITVNAYKEERADLTAYDVESAPVINYINRILIDAITKGASDIHFEHYENTYRIRFRQNGILYPVTAPPIKLANYLLARIKVMSDLDITEHRIPQDGRFKLILSKNRSVDFRVSICPTVFGEKVVLRVLDASNTTQGVVNLGMEKIQQENLIAALKRSQGMILVTGPTGSGKTVTLYSSLNFLNSIEKNISTVEDPVEIPLQGINQVHVNIKSGLSFSTVLRSFLRQDPDIIMVGEIRDLETAEIAVKAAQTGHLVLSTLHTNSASETITRLMNMGIASYNLASSLTLIVAQRLVRLLCDECKQVEEIPKEVLIREGFSEKEIGSFTLYTNKGCERCMQGFKGRIGIFEVMPITNELADLIMHGGNSLEIISLAKKEGISSLRESGLKKVKEGITSLGELNRVFK